MLRRAVAVYATVAASAALSALVAAGQSATRGQSTAASHSNAEPDSRGQIALIIDGRGLEWCDRALCVRTVRVLAVIRNRTRYAVTDEITIMRRREDAPWTTTQIFLRGECATGRTPIWRVFPNSEPIDKHSRNIFAAFGPAN